MQGCCTAVQGEKIKTYRDNREHFTSLMQLFLHFWTCADPIFPLHFRLDLVGCCSGERLKGVKRARDRKQSREKMYLIGRKLRKDGEEEEKIRPLQKMETILHSPQSYPNQRHRPGWTMPTPSQSQGYYRWPPGGGTAEYVESCQQARPISEAHHFRDHLTRARQTNKTMLANLGQILLETLDGVPQKHATWLVGSVGESVAESSSLFLFSHFFSHFFYRTLSIPTGK